MYIYIYLYMYTVYIYNCIYTLTSNWYLFHFWVQLVPHRALRWPVMRDARRLAQWMVYDGTCPKDGIPSFMIIYGNLWKPLLMAHACAEHMDMDVIWMSQWMPMDVSMDANG